MEKRIPQVVPMPMVAAAYFGFRAFGMRWIVVVMWTPIFQLFGRCFAVAKRIGCVGAGMALVAPLERSRWTLPFPAGWLRTRLDCPSLRSRREGELVFF